MAVAMDLGKTSEKANKAAQATLRAMTVAVSALEMRTDAREPVFTLPWGDSPHLTLHHHQTPSPSDILRGTGESL